MKLIPISEAQAKQFKKHGIEPEVTYAIPESLFNLVSTLGKKKRRFSKTGTTTIKITQPSRKSGVAKLDPKLEYTFWPAQSNARDSSNTGAVVIKMTAYGIKSGGVVTRGFVYKLIPEGKQAWVVYDMVKNGVLVLV